MASRTLIYVSKAEHLIEKKTFPNLRLHTDKQNNIKLNTQTL